MDERLSEEATVRRCPICGGTFEQRFVTFVADEATLLVEGVPAEVCKQCGEQVYSWSVAKVLEQLQLGALEPETYRQVPAFEFESARSHLRKQPASA
jgi:YgiT-type zinc finger domain-containing protein